MENDPPRAVEQRRSHKGARTEAGIFVGKLLQESRLGLTVA